MTKKILIKKTLKQQLRDCRATYGAEVKRHEKELQTWKDKYYLKVSALDECKEKVEEHEREKEKHRFGEEVGRKTEDSVQVRMLKEENSRLWYMIRHHAGDKLMVPPPQEGRRHQNLNLCDDDRTPRDPFPFSRY